MKSGTQKALLTPAEKKLLKTAAMSLCYAVSAARARQNGDAEFADQVEAAMSLKQKAIVYLMTNVVNKMHNSAKEH